MAKRTRKATKETNAGSAFEKSSSLENVSLNEMAYRTLRRAIIFCELAPGTCHTEIQLLERFKMSKAPIRSALTRLGHEGLIDAQARKGYVVTSITYQDVQDIFSLRLILEPKAARLAAGHLSDEHIARILPTLEVEYRHDDHASHIEFLKANRTFYMTIVEAAGNRRLVDAISGLLDEMTRLLQLIIMSMSIYERARTEHRELLMMLLTGDAEAAEQLAYQQVKNRQQSFMDAILENPNVLTMHEESKGFILTGNIPAGKKRA